MNRFYTYVFGPETLSAVIAAGVFWFCARHNSGTGRDVDVLEKLVMLLPFLVVPMVFATLIIPGAKNWWWLGRAITITFIVLAVCAMKIIAGFGTGAKGQDAAFILVFTFGIILVSLATAVCGTVILAATKPAFAEWFCVRWILGSLLTLLSAVPIGFGLGAGLALLLGVVGGIWTAFQR